MSSSPAVHLADLHKSFRGRQGHCVTAVDGLSLDIRPGEVVALLGPNGAGKTTTIDMILGLANPSGGAVEVFGRPPRDAVAHGLVAAVMQTGGLLPDLTVRETVEITASLFSHSVRVAEAVERAGLESLASRQVRKCSGGEKQRIRFAMALVCDPTLMILDEPTTGMDVEARRSFWQAIHADAALGRTVLFATHYLEEADEFADRIILMRSGIDRGKVLGILGGLDLQAVEVLGSALTVVADDTDPVALALLREGAAADLDISSRGLEDAFIALTSSTGTTGAIGSGTTAGAPPLAHSHQKVLA